MLRYLNLNSMKNYRSKLDARGRRGFTMIEVIAAMAILAMITTSVLVVMNRCIEATIDSGLEVEAFELARENMERLLASDLVKDMVEFGTSEKNEDIEWKKVVESFYEPVTSRMWIQGVCSASYTDSKGQEQTIELTHWLTNVTKAQLMQILDQEKREREYLEELGESEGYGYEMSELIYDEAKDQYYAESPTEKVYFGSDYDVAVEKRIEYESEERQRLSTEGKSFRFGSRPYKGDAESADYAADIDTHPPDNSYDRGTEIYDGHTLEELNKMSFEEVWQILMKNRDK